MIDDRYAAHRIVGNDDDAEVVDRRDFDSWAEMVDATADWPPVTVLRIMRRAPAWTGTRWNIAEVGRLAVDEIGPDQILGVLEEHLTARG